jgi:hypothetical protein
LKKLKSGLGQAVVSTLIGMILVISVSYLVKIDWIPAYSTTILSLLNIAASLLAMRKMRRWGIFYAIGWLTGAFLFNALGLFEPIDVVFNIVAPIVILILRFLLWVKNSLRKVSFR